MKARKPPKYLEIDHRLRITRTKNSAILSHRGEKLEPWETLPSGALAAGIALVYLDYPNRKPWQRELCRQYLERWPEGPQIRGVGAKKRIPGSKSHNIRLTRQQAGHCKKIAGSMAGGVRKCIEQHRALTWHADFMPRFTVGMAVPAEDYLVLSHHHAPMFCARLYRQQAVPQAWVDSNATMRLVCGYVLTHIHWYAEEKPDPVVQTRLMDHIDDFMFQFLELRDSR